MASHPYVQFFLLAAGATAFLGLTLGLAFLLRPRKPSAAKAGTYECGEEPVGTARVQFPAQFYLLALLFVVFEVEAVYLIPWALKLGDFMHNPVGEGVGTPWFVVIEMAVFLFILILGWLYALRKGALEWMTE